MISKVNINDLKEKITEFKKIQKNYKLFFY